MCYNYLNIATNHQPYSETRLTHKLYSTFTSGHGPPGPPAGYGPESRTQKKIKFLFISVINFIKFFKDFFSVLKIFQNCRIKLSKFLQYVKIF